MTELHFWKDGDTDALAEYQAIKASRPAVARAIRDAITVIWDDPDTAEQQYSVRLDPRARYFGLPFDSPDGLTCLTWRQDPDGYDSVWVVNFTEPWGDLPFRASGHALSSSGTTPAATVRESGTVGAPDLYDLMHAGKIRSVKDGHMRFITLDALRDYVRQLVDQADEVA